MQTNDFGAASFLLDDAFELHWPQSCEVVRGRVNFAAINTHYPAQGRWHFSVNKLLAEGDEVVSDVSVTDGVTKARAITFSTVRGGLIVKQTEFWPDPYEAPAWRRAWTERA
jgi:hypothetical protein